MTDRIHSQEAFERLITLLDREWPSVNIYHCGLWRNQGWDGPANSFEIAYYVQGANTIIQDGDTVRVKEGDLLLLPDTIRNSSCESGQFKAYYLSFVFEGSDTQVKMTRELYASVTPANRPLWIPGLEFSFSKLLAEFHLNRSGSLLLKHYFLHVLVQAYQAFTRYDGRRASSIRIRHEGLTEDLISRMNEEYAGKVRISELAEKYGMNERYLNHVFKSVTGAPIARYLTGIRIEQAKRLLQTTRMTVTEIALDTGFYDASHFCKTFKSIEGVSPTEYAAIRSAPG